LREAVNNRQQALEAWQKSKGESDQYDIDGSRERLALTTKLLEQSKSEFEARNAETLRMYREGEQASIYGFDEAVAPGIKLLDSEVKNSVTQGAPTKGLIQLAHDGARAPFNEKMAKLASQVIKEQQDKLSRLEQELKKLKGGGTSGGRGDSMSPGEAKKKVEPKDYVKGSGILQTMAEMGVQS
jgi:hypothetical protein